jgi:hypothetical protein
VGFFFRKSFKLGPLRVNASKSGLGISGGIRGARVGIGPRGPYIAASKEGIYYRKHLGGATDPAAGQPSTMAASAVVVLLAFAAVLVAGMVFVLWVILRA